MQCIFLCDLYSWSYILLNEPSLWIKTSFQLHNIIIFYVRIKLLLCKELIKANLTKCSTNFVSTSEWRYWPGHQDFSRQFYNRDAHGGKKLDAIMETKMRHIFLQYFLVVLKRSLQNYKKILKKCFLVTDSNWRPWTNYCLEVVITISRLYRVKSDERP